MDKVGRVAVCRRGIPGVVEDRIPDANGRWVYLGHQLLDPTEGWQSMDPRWLSPSESDELLSRLYSQDMS